MRRTEQGRKISQSQIRVNERIAELTNTLSDRVIGVRTVGDAILYALDYLWQCDRNAPDQPGIHPIRPLPDIRNGFQIDGTPWVCFHPAKPGAFRRTEPTGEIVAVDIGHARTSHVTVLSEKFAMSPKDVYRCAIALVKDALAAEHARMNAKLKRLPTGSLEVIVSPKRILVSPKRATRAA